jgi:bifunctional DNA-binding transcriptional regulator/antitoxin component of YhaV-PrlF toxin-antitoxin module
MPHSTLTIKGQATIPLVIRRFLKVKPRDKIAFRIDNGKVLLEPVQSCPEALFGKYGKSHGKKMSVKDMNEAVFQEAESLNK